METCADATVFLEGSSVVPKLVVKTAKDWHIGKEVSLLWIFTWSKMPDWLIVYVSFQRFVPVLIKWISLLLTHTTFLQDKQYTCWYLTIFWWAQGSPFNICSSCGKNWSHISSQTVRTSSSSMYKFQLTCNSHIIRRSSYSFCGTMLLAPTM